MPVLEAAAKGDPDIDAWEAEVLRVLVEQAPALGIPSKVAAAWTHQWDSYLDALKGFSALAVADAFRRWNRGEMYPADPGRHGFYPKPVELKHLADTFRREMIMAAYRCKRGLDYTAPPAERTPEQRKADREAAIKEGILTPDGKVNLAGLGGSNAMPPPARAPGLTPQQMAERLRAQADDIGDVI